MRVTTRHESYARVFTELIPSMTIHALYVAYQLDTSKVYIATRTSIIDHEDAIEELESRPLGRRHAETL